MDFMTTGDATPCDTCRRPTRVGFMHTHLETPVLFECHPCAERTDPGGTARAIERSKSAWQPGEDTEPPAC
jgi:hypothetical protein